MQMRVDDQRNIWRSDANLIQAILEQGSAIRALVLQTVDILEFFIFLVAGARVDEDEPRRMLNEQAAHAQPYAVSLVRTDALFPEWLRNDAEHRTAIEFLTAGLDRVNSEVADLAALHQRSWRGHAVVSRVTGVGNPDGLRFLRRPAGARSNV